MKNRDGGDIDIKTPNPSGPTWDGGDIDEE